MICYFLKYHKWSLRSSKPTINKHPILVRFTADVIFDQGSKTWKPNPKTTRRSFKRKNVLIFDDSTTPPTLLRDDLGVLIYSRGYFSWSSQEPLNQTIRNKDVLPALFFWRGDLVDQQLNVINERTGLNERSY